MLVLAVLGAGLLTAASHPGERGVTAEQVVLTAPVGTLPTGPAPVGFVPTPRIQMALVAAADQRLRLEAATSVRFDDSGSRIVFDRFRPSDRTLSVIASGNDESAVRARVNAVSGKYLRFRRHELVDSVRSEIESLKVVRLARLAERGRTADVDRRIALAEVTLARGEQQVAPSGGAITVAFEDVPGLPHRIAVSVLVLSMFLLLALVAQRRRTHPRG